MDVRTRTLGTRIAAFLCLLVGAAVLGHQKPAPIHRPPLIHGATAAEERTIDWAARRYRDAGLRSLPQLDVYAHATGEGCGGDLARYYRGRIDLCARYSGEPYVRTFVLHEFAHAWIETNGTPAVLQRFMQLRRIEAWDDRSLLWDERGTEQAAEIIAWGLGEGEIAPRLPEATDGSTLVRLYELLTGRDPITRVSR